MIGTRWPSPFRAAPHWRRLRNVDPRRAAAEMMALRNLKRDAAGNLLRSKTSGNLRTDCCKCGGCPCGSDGTGCNTGTSPKSFLCTLNHLVPTGCCVEFGPTPVGFIYPVGTLTTFCLTGCPNCYSGSQGTGAHLAYWESGCSGTLTAVTSCNTISWSLIKSTNLWTLSGYIYGCGTSDVYCIFRAANVVSDPLDCDQSLSFLNQVVCGSIYNDSCLGPSYESGGLTTDATTVAVLTPCCP